MRFITKTELQLLLSEIKFSEPIHLKKVCNEIPYPPLPPSPPRYKIEKIILKIKKLIRDDSLSKNKFNNKELKLIPYTFYFEYKGERFVDHPEIIKKLLTILDKPMHYIIKRLIKIYFLEYNNSQSDFLIRDFLYNYLTKNKSRKVGSEWFKNRDLFFSSESFHKLIDKIDSENSPTKNLLNIIKYKNILSSNFMKFLVIFYSKNIKDNFSNKKIEKLFDLLCEDFEKRKLRFSESILPEIANNIIPLIPEKEKDKIFQFFIDILGNPLYPKSRIKWHEISENVLKIITQWLTKQNIEFFFEIVSNIPNSDPKWKYRRKFWEACIPYIEQSWVVLSHRIIYYPSIYNILKQKKIPFGKLTGASSNQCVFLIKIKNYIFVEWNTSGALRIYDVKSFPLQLGLDEYRSYSLRNDNFLERIIHNNPEIYSWQKKLSKWLYKNLGIYISNYRL